MGWPNPIQTGTTGNSAITNAAQATVIPSNVTVGNCVILAVQTNGVTDVVNTLTTTFGTASFIARNNGVTGTVDTEFWIVPSAASAGNQVTVSGSGGNTWNCFAMELPGSASDYGGAVLSTSSSSTPALTITPSYNGQLILAAAQSNSSSFTGLSAPSSPWIDSTGPASYYWNWTGPGNFPGGAAFQLAPSPASVTATWVMTGSAPWIAVGAIITPTTPPSNNASVFDLTLGKGFMGAGPMGGGGGSITNIIYQKLASIISTNLINAKKTASRIRKVTANVTNLINTVYSHATGHVAISKLVNVISTNLIKSNKIAIRIKTSKVIQTPLINSTKVAKRIKTAVTNSIYLISTKSLKAKNKFSSAIQIGLISTKKIATKVRISKTIQVSLIQSTKIAIRVRLSAVIQVSLVTTLRLSKKIRYSTTVQVPLSTALKTARRIKVSSAVQTPLVTTAKALKRIKTAVAKQINIIKSSKSLKKNLRIIQTLLINSAKSAKYLRLGSVLQIDLSKAVRSARFVNKIAIAIGTNLIASSKQFKRVRTSSAIVTNVIISSKLMKRIRASKVIQTPLILSVKSAKRVKTVSANVINLVKVVKSARFVNKISIVVHTGLINSTKQLKRVRKASTIGINLIMTSRTRKIFKAAIPIQTLLIVSVKSASRIKKASITTVNVLISTKAFKRTKTSIVNQINLLSSLKTNRRLKKASATEVNIIKSNKGRFKAIKMVVTNLIASIKAYHPHGAAAKLVAAIQAPFIFVKKGVGRKKKSSTLQIVSATITKNVNKNRNGSVLITYEIGSNKGKTMFRKAVATAIGLIKYNLSRVSNIRLQENANVQPISQINSYVLPSDLDQSGTYTGNNDGISVTYDEQIIDNGGNYDISEPLSPPNFVITHAQSGEDIVPT